jgi:hypothetical protein
VRTLTITAIALTIVITAGCNNSKSPDAVANDVAKAEQKAATEVANRENDASKDIANQSDKVGDKVADLNNAAAKDAYSIAVAKADGDRKVALAKCDALSGDAQKGCKDQANADYDAVKANAKAAEVSEKQ